MVRFGATGGRVGLRGLAGATAYESEVVLSTHGARRARLNGAVLRSADQLRQDLRTLVFTPDRLAVVKGAPATRRAYLDRSLGRLFPSRSSLPVEYAGAAGQRNASLRRVAAGGSSPDALSPWTEAVSRLGAELVEARRAALDVLAPYFAESAERLLLAAATIAYEGEAASVDDYEARLQRDLERCVTGLGPHLHDVRIEAGGRDLRSFGSQGEQRVAVLALVLAESRAIEEREGVRPLVLLDDVLSELDDHRRRALAELIATGGQTVVTATSEAALPAEPALSLVVTPGVVRSA